VWTFINDCKDNFLVDKDIELFWSSSDGEESTCVFLCESDSEEQDSYDYFNCGKIQVARDVSIEEFHEKLVSLLEDYMWNISVLFSQSRTVVLDLPGSFRVMKSSNNLILILDSGAI